MVSSLSSGSTTGNALVLSAYLPAYIYILTLFVSLTIQQVHRIDMFIYFFFMFKRGLTVRTNDYSKLCDIF
jgi:hypothetical protein